MFPSLRDLAELDPAYLSENFCPWEHGLTSRELHAALLTLEPKSRERLMGHCSPECGRRLTETARGPEPEADEIRAAAVRLLAVYFWEIIYQRYAHAYSAFSDCQIFPFEDLFPKAAVNRRKVAEIAAGAGKLTEHLCSYASEVLAIDPSKPLLDVLIQRCGSLARVTASIGSFRSLPLPDASVDLVASNMGFQSNEERGGEAGLAEMMRILRTGGELRLVVGGEMTGRWLKLRGFREVAIHRPVLWRIPDSPSLTPLLKTLLTSVGVPTKPGTIMPDRWLFAPRRASLKRFQASATALLTGTAPQRVFDRGLPWRPLGCSVMVFRK